MTVVAFLWGRRVKESRRQTDDLVQRTEVSQKRINAKIARVDAARSHAEKAAVDLLSRHDDLLRAAAHHRN